MMFVSYSRSDIAAAREVVESLSALGVECWLDDSNIPVGQAFVERLGTALREADCFLLMDTLSSRSSYWVSRELETSRCYIKDGRYHSSLRLYSLDCEHDDTVNWNASLPLNQHAPHQIAKFLADRRRVQHTPELDSERESVSMLNDTGLGQPSNWTGRQDEMRALDEWWFGSLPGAWLSGLGGNGKSGLLQTWVTALIYLGYHEPVSASALYLQGNQINVTEAQQTLFAWKSRVAEARRLLLLDGYDEARSTRDVDEVLAQAIQSGARTLVTSRSAVPQPLARYFANLRLHNMTRRDSVALLNQFGVTGPDSEQLAAELGDHPLALIILSRSLAGANKTAAEAIGDLRRIHSEGAIDTSRSIRATLSNSVRSLTSDARSLLERLCWTAEDVVAPPDLTQPAIGELAKAGLVQVDHLEAPHQVSIHPLVRRFIREEQATDPQNLYHPVC